jgi:cbb3-type cytochrome oxidase cytochrome c subunit
MPRGRPKKDAGATAQAEANPIDGGKVSQIDMMCAALKALGEDAEQSTYEQWVKDHYDGATIGTFAVTKSNAKKKMAKMNGEVIPAKKRGATATAPQTGPTALQTMALAKTLGEKKITLTKLGEQLDEINELAKLVGGLDNLGTAIDTIKAFHSVKL